MTPAQSVEEAARALLNAIDVAHDTLQPPQKYGVPYRAVNDLRAAVLRLRPITDADIGENGYLVRTALESAGAAQPVAPNESNEFLDAIEGRTSDWEACSQQNAPRRHPDRILHWAMSRWEAEVKNRPLVNVHRRTLDDTWRQVIRHFGGDPAALLGPAHDDFLIQEKT